MALKVTPREFSIHIGDKEYQLSPTFSAIAEIEARTGKGITPIVSSFMTGTFALTDMVTIIWAGIKANYRANKLNMKDLPAYEVLGDEIQAAGYGNIIPELIEFVTALINGTEKIEPSEPSDGEPEKNA